MMQQLRKSTKVIMVLVSITFVGLMVFEWGMDLSGRSSRQGTGTSLGSVDGTDISVDDYQRQYQILYEEASARAPEGLSREQLEQIEQQAWNDVVDLTLLRHEAERRGLRVTDSELVEYIRYNPPPEVAAMPAFQTEGQFDLAKYQAALADPALEQTWLEYERQLRSTLPIQKLQEQVIAGTIVTEAEARQVYRDRNERAKIEYIHLDPQILARDAAAGVTDADIRTYYDEHAEFYRDRPYEEVEPQIRQILRAQRMEQVQSAGSQRELMAAMADSQAQAVEVETFPDRYERVLAELRERLEDPESAARGSTAG